MTWATGIYLLTSIFGLGVTAIDMLGLLGGHDADADADGDLDLGHGDAGGLESSGHEASGGHIGAGHVVAGHAGGGHAGGGHAGGGHGSSRIGGHAAADHGGLDASEGTMGADLQAGVEGGGEGHTSEHSPVPHTAGASQDGSYGSHSPLLATSFLFLTYLRRSVYFSLGFGPVGMAAIVTGSSVLGSLAWAVPCGILSTFLAGWFFQLQQNDLDSSVTNRDLFFQRATVLVPISAGGMGKVRVTLGQSVVDRYARAEVTSQTFAKGDEVCITRIANDCVFVEAFSPEISSEHT